MGLSVVTTTNKPRSEVDEQMLKDFLATVNHTEKIGDTTLRFPSRNEAWKAGDTMRRHVQASLGVVVNVRTVGPLAAIAAEKNDKGEETSPAVKAGYIYTLITAAPVNRA